MPIQRTDRLFAFALAVSALCVAGACSDKTPRSAQVASPRRLHSDSAGGLVVAPKTPYVQTVTPRPAELVISIASDSVAAPREPSNGTCEVPAAKPSNVSGAVLWVDGIRQGKPLPQDRRYELVSAGCALAPRIQGVVVGGAINVFNDDRVLHKLIFIRAGTSDTLQTMPFTNDAELVASDRLTRTPGIIDVRCAQHPQERAYIAVFDHPYFGVASPGEKVTLDSLPSGDYQVVAWREGMSAPSTVATKVGASGQTRVVVK